MALPNLAACLTLPQLGRAWACRPAYSITPYPDLPGPPGQSRYDATPQPVYKAHDILPFTLPLTAATQQNRSSHAQM